MPRWGLIFALSASAAGVVCGEQFEDSCLLQIVQQTQQVPVEFANLHVARDADFMQWNGEQIPVEVALQIGWNLPIDVVGPGVYGGVVKRDEFGTILVGDEWPEDNRAPPAHNPVHSTGPYLDFSKFGATTQGYPIIADVIMTGSSEDLANLLLSITSDLERQFLANLVMTGGARPLHMCGMSRGGDASDMIRILIDQGADVNAKDNYEMTPLDRLASNSVSGATLLQENGGVSGTELPSGAPDWTSGEYMYAGAGVSDN